MKRLLATLTLILCLSFPVLAGHVLPGGYACSCEQTGCIEDFPGECGGNTNQQSTPSDLGSGTLLILAALLLGLKATKYSFARFYTRLQTSSQVFSEFML